MKKEDIMRRAIGEIDDDLIEDADIDEDSPVPLRRRKPVRKRKLSMRDKMYQRGLTGKPRHMMRI